MHPSNLANNAEAFFFNVVGNVDIITIIRPLYDPFDASCSQKLLPCLLEFILVINIEAFVHYVRYLVILSWTFHFDYKIDNLCTSMLSNSQIVKVNATVEDISLSKLKCCWIIICYQTNSTSSHLKFQIRWCILLYIMYIVLMKLYFGIL